MKGQFRKDFFASKIIDKQWDNSNTSTEKIFIDFAKKLEKLGIFAKYIVSHNKYDSRCLDRKSQSVPVLSLSIVNFAEYDIDEMYSNWSGDFYLTDEIRSLWKSECVNNNISAEYYSETMLVLIYNSKQSELISLTYHCKKQIIEYFKKEYKIRHIFCSSKPAINIFFKSRNELNTLITNGRLAKFKNDIEKIFYNTDIFSIYDNNIDIMFFDWENTENKYGYSRED
jgi:hypothetical protein